MPKLRANHHACDQIASWAARRGSGLWSLSVTTEDEKQKWITDIIENNYIPTTHDPEEAVRAFHFFTGSSFPEHRIRFLKTWDIIERNFDLSNKDIAEAGKLSGLSKYYQSAGHNVVEVDGDFRYEMKAQTESADVLFSFEVFEHIKDKDPANFEDIILFNFSGVRTFISEMYRILRPGGHLIMTTPNACSLINAVRLCNNEPPWVYWPHVREYSSREVIDLCKEAGFELKFFDTMYCFFYFAPGFEYDLQKYIGSTGASTEHRGDDMFFIFRKPEEATMTKIEGQQSS